MKQQKNSEKREHKRHPASKNTIVISQENIGQVVDISAGGLGLEYLCVENIPDRWHTDILSGKGTFFLEDLPVKLAWEGTPKISPDTDTMSQVIGVNFDQPSEEQQQKLNRFIEKLAD